MASRHAQGTPVGTAVGAAVDAVVVTAPLTPSDLQALCADVRAGLSAGAASVAVELGPRMPASLCVVDAVARLQLAARRAGGVIVLRGASPELVELLDLAGLADVVDRPRAAADPPP